jgi:hypothetical protein
LTLAEITKQSGLENEMAEFMGVELNTASKIERNFGEITSTADFKRRCVDYKKGCAIGMIPANLMIDYERENFDQHIETLTALDEKAKKQSQPMFYSWVNVTCHPEALKFFNIDQF